MMSPDAASTTENNGTCWGTDDCASPSARTCCSAAFALCEDPAVDLFVEVSPDLARDDDDAEGVTITDVPCS